MYFIQKCTKTCTECLNRKCVFSLQLLITWARVEAVEKMLISIHPSIFYNHLFLLRDLHILHALIKGTRCTSTYCMCFFVAVLFRNCNSIKKRTVKKVIEMSPGSRKANCQSYFYGKTSWGPFQTWHQLIKLPEDLWSKCTRVKGNSDWCFPFQPWEWMWGRAVRMVYFYLRMHTDRWRNTECGSVFLLLIRSVSGYWTKHFLGCLCWMNSYSSSPVFFTVCNT